MQNPVHHHGGCCCFCFDHHSGFPQSILTRGCYRPALSRRRAFAWLADVTPSIFLSLVLQQHDDHQPRRLHILSCMLVEVLHSMKFILASLPAQVLLYRLPLCRQQRCGFVAELQLIDTELHLEVCLPSMHRERPSYDFNQLGQEAESTTV